MIRQPHSRNSRSSRWTAYGSGALILWLVASLLQFARPAIDLQNSSWAAKTQPALQALIAHGKPESVRVIIQLTGNDDHVAELIAGAGGAVIDELPIIRSVVATAPAAALPQIAALPAVRWVSLDAAMMSSKAKGSDSPAAEPSLAPATPNTYLDTIGVRPVWSMGIKGRQIGIAIIDSGIDNSSKDLTSIVSDDGSFSPNSRTINDVYGHGTHIAGIISGNGSMSSGYYMGIAPEAILLNLKISDESGLAYESDTVKAMQWVLDHKTEYNIRVVNLSINSTVEASYHTSPINAAAEILWFNGVVIVASAGNVLPGQTFNPINSAPANDPLIITVGASDEKYSSYRNDDVMAPFSAAGVTLDGFNKPELLAPGMNIISLLSEYSPWAKQYPQRVELDGKYFRLSGTSMAAPMVAGAVALLLQNEPSLTPDQVKYRLTHSSTMLRTDDGQEYPYLNVYAAIKTESTESANTGLPVSQLLFSGSDPVTWGSVNWNSVNWNSVNWNSVNWNSVNWNSVNWNSGEQIGAASVEGKLYTPVFWDGDEAITDPDGSTGSDDEPADTGGSTGSDDEPADTGGSTGSDDEPADTGGSTGSDDEPADTGGSTGSDDEPADTGGSTDSDEKPTDTGGEEALPQQTLFLPALAR